MYSPDLEKYDIQSQSSGLSRIVGGTRSSPPDSPLQRLMNVSEPIEKPSVPSHFVVRGWRSVVRFFTEDSFVGAVFNLSNSTIGAGVLFLPFVLQETGVVFGLTFIMLGGMLGAVTLFLLYKCYEIITTEHDPSIIDYEQIGHLCYGRGLSFFVQFCIFMLNFGCTISYMIVVSDLLKGWIPNPYIHAGVLFAAMLPFVLLSMSHKISSLRFLSYFSISAILLFVFMVILGYFLHQTDNDKAGEVVYVPDLDEFETWNHIFAILGVVTFAYACHTNLCPVASEFKPENRHLVGKGVFFSILIDYLLYAGIASFGYLSFLGNTRSDIISSYSGTGWLASALRINLAIAICSTYPMASYPARYTLNNLINDAMEMCCGSFLAKYFYLPKTAAAGEKQPLLGPDALSPGTSSSDGVVDLVIASSSSTATNHEPMLQRTASSSSDAESAELPQEMHTQTFEDGHLPAYIETDLTSGMPIVKPLKPVRGAPTRLKKAWDAFLIIFNTASIGLISYALAIGYPHASDIFGLVGSTASTCTAYVFPCLFYLKLAKPKLCSWRTFAVVGILLFGIAFGLFVTGNNLYKMIAEVVVKEKARHHNG